MLHIVVVGVPVVSKDKGYLRAVIHQWGLRLSLKISEENKRETDMKWICDQETSEAASAFLLFMVNILLVAIKQSELLFCEWGRFQGNLRVSKVSVFVPQD